MYLVAYGSLWLVFLLSVFLGLALIYALWKGEHSFWQGWVELGQRVCFFLMLLASAILLQALVARDFSYVYVANYTDSFLSWYYAISAFWAGQSGSFLFWTLCLALFGMFWSFSPKYRQLQVPAKAYFWLFFLGLQAFFLIFLLGSSNPFEQYAQAPAQGGGLNPLLQDVAMVFHPPLMFLAYAGFAIPACVALAVHLSGDRMNWLLGVRNWTLVSWIFLSAGIILGAWWAYLELGWGGYWAWDPVENASLLPWFAATAFIHTSLVGRKHKSLGRSNLLLIVFTLILCLLATFLTRGGMLDSVHAFGQSGVGKPLLFGIVFSCLLLLVVAVFSQNRDNRALSDLFSRQGVVVMLSWLLVALVVIIAAGTKWPLISSLWTQDTTGLTADFYNRICLPLFTLILLFLAFCPWLGWRYGKHKTKQLLGLGLFFLAVGLVLWLQGMQKPLALFAAALSLTVCASIVLLFVQERAIRSQRSMWSAYGVHLGLALLALGIAFSGPYKQEKEVVLSKGESVQLGSYEVEYQSLESYSEPGFQAVQASLQVSKKDRVLGSLNPERRRYQTMDRPYAQVSTLPSLGVELYSVLHGFDQEERIRLELSSHPLVNWIWIGGTLLCLLAFLGLGSSRRQKTDNRGLRTEDS
ncbi:MAG: cytochrome c-type biogenesis CcmF C-terminal domain-containing protein [Desulfohalobiaceae bacterium]